MTVYFIQSGENGPVKIGYTSNQVRSRMSELQCGNPVKMELLGVIDSADIECEKAIHIAFSHLRIRGEWFHGTTEIMDYIDQCCAPLDTEVADVAPVEPYMLPDLVPADDFRKIVNVSHELPEDFAGGKNVLKDYFKRVHGSKTRLAEYIGTTKGAISQWNVCPLNRVNQVSAFTGIPKNLLRPDIFGEAS